MKLSDLTIDTDRAESGVWWNYATRQPCVGNKPHATDFCVLVRAIGDKFQNAMRDAMAPFVMASRRGKVEADGARASIAKVWASEVLMDWANLDGIPHSHDCAVEFMREDRFRLIREFVEQAARAEWAYLADAEEDAKGN